MLMTNKLTLPVESRMQGDLHVRFGGRLWETYHRKVVRRPSPSLHVKYAAEPLLLNVEMCDFIHDHTEIKNQSNVPFDVDYITWKIVDKKVAKRTAVQEQIILPLRAQNYATLVPGKKSERTVFTMAKFTIPDDKCLVVELNEKNGGRHQSFVIENEDLVRAGTINELQVR